MKIRNLLQQVAAQQLGANLHALIKMDHASSVVRIVNETVAARKTVAAADDKCKFLISV